MRFSLDVGFQVGFFKNYWSVKMREKKSLAKKQIRLFLTVITKFKMY